MSLLHAGRIGPQLSCSSVSSAVPVLLRSLSHAFNTADDNVVGRQLPGLDGSAVLAGRLDALVRPAITAIQHGARGGELRRRRDRHHHNLGLLRRPEIDHDHAARQLHQPVDHLAIEAAGIAPDVDLDRALLDWLSRTPPGLPETTFGNGRPGPPCLRLWLILGTADCSVC